MDQIGPEYLDHGARTVGDRQVANVLHHVADIRKMIREGAVLPRVKARAELMISLVSDFWAGRYRQVPYRSVALMVFALSYVLAPIDIVPDTLPVIGEIDDAIVMALCARMVSKELTAYGVWKTRTRKKRPARAKRVTTR